MFKLSANPSDLRFPSVDLASPEGLLAVGGDLRPERLLEAYRHGIFPWYEEDQPILRGLESYQSDMSYPRSAPPNVVAMFLTSLLSN